MDVPMVQLPFTRSCDMMVRSDTIVSSEMTRTVDPT
jgi:hypothetical protein